MTTPVSRLGGWRRRVGCTLLATALALSSLPLRAQNSALPALGDAATEALDVNDEARLAQEIMRAVRGDPAYLDDPVLQAYLESVFDPLVAVARRSGQIGPDIDRAFAWTSFLVREPSVNAFAMPGGLIGVHLGLIAMTEHPDELASVLAHELSHVTQRHISRSLGDAQRTGMIGIAAMLLGLVLAARSNSPDMAQAAVAGGQAAMLQGQLNYSRDMEREADRIGYGLLVGAGHAPGSMAAMFEKLATANRLNDSGSFPYLRSHPLTTERIAEARARVADGAAPEGPVPTLHALMRARATVLMAPGTTALQRALQAPGDELPSLYRRALAAAQLRDAPAAEALLGPLEVAAGRPGLAPEIRRALRMLAAEMNLSLRRPKAAVALVDAADTSRPAMLLRAEIARSLPDPAQPTARTALDASVQALQAWVIDHPEDTGAWWALSQGAAALGQPVRARRAEAEARWTSGDLNAALATLQTARRLPPGDEAIELHVIEARWRVFEAERRRRMEEARLNRR
jgi:beta-barrel assembly-enhancing protease